MLINNKNICIVNLNISGLTKINDSNVNIFLSIRHFCAIKIKLNFNQSAQGLSTNDTIT